MSEVRTVKFCLKEMKNEPYEHTNCSAGCDKPPLIEDTAQGAACFLGLERFTVCLANDSL